MPIKIFCVLMMIIIIMRQAYAIDEPYYASHAQGWHWYDDPKINEKKKESLTFNVEPKDPVAAMTAVRATVNKALDKAIINPTPDNINQYIVLQNQLSDQSSLFSERWQEVLLNHPELNYQLIHPTNSVASQLDSDLKNKDMDRAIKKLAQISGLFFFYKSTCPYCQRFAPILKDFAERFNLTIIPISMDGIALPEFPNSKIDRGQAVKFHVTVEPSLFMVNPYTHKAFPISYGLVSEEELRSKILNVIKLEGSS